MKQYTKYAEGFKRTLVDEFLVEYRSSGLYASAFARRKGVNESTFLGWLETLDGDREYPRKLPGARKKAPRIECNFLISQERLFPQICFAV